MTSPYMYDSAGELSEEFAVELVDRGDVCYIFMTPDADRLNDASRVYSILCIGDALKASKLPHRQSSVVKMKFTGYAVIANRIRRKVHTFRRILNRYFWDLSAVYIGRNRFTRRSWLAE